MGIGKTSPDRSQFVKQTLIHSPIFTNIFPTFNVDISKKFRGLPNTSIDESDQYLVPNEDSQMDAFDDDDDDFSMIGRSTSTGETTNSGTDQIRIDKIESELVTIKIIVKITSILVNNIEYSFPAPIRSSCMVNGVKDHETGRFGEDSILISLKSGFLFLIRVFLVPREYTDKYYGKEWDAKSSQNLIYKPFIVQWWDTGSNLQMPSLDSSGFQLISHSSGQSTVSASASNVFRIYNSQLTKAGTLFGQHTNVPVDGIILNSCFAEPLPDCIDENHIMFLALIFTENRRLELNLFEWISTELPSPLNLTKKVLPLNNSFPIPIFIIPLRKNTSFLFVSELDLTVISIHQIISVEFDFHVKSIEQISFPTAFYIPFSNISHVTDDNIDEVILATDAGCIYSILINKNEEITINLIARISDPISVFAIERVGKEYSIIFGSDTGSNREVIIGDLFDEDIKLANTNNKKYSKTRLITDYKNWAPLLDVLIIDSFKLRSLTNYIDQELWTLAGIGKRTRLTQLRSGYNAERMGKVFSKLRKAEKIFVQEVHNRIFFLLSYPFHTKIFEYFDDAEDEDELLIDMDDMEEEDKISLILDEATMSSSKITKSVNVQITTNTVCITNLIQKPLVRSFERKLIFSDIIDSHILLVTEIENQDEDKIQTVLELMEVASEMSDFSEVSDITEVLKLIRTIKLDDEPSMAKFFKVDNEIFIAIGNFDGTIEVKGVFNSTFDKKMYLSSFNPYHQSFASGCEHLNIPHDIFVHRVQNLNQFSIGTKDGYLINVSFSLEADQPMEFNCTQFLKVSDTAVEFCEIQGDSMVYFIISRNLWLVNLHQSVYPQKVFFNETTDRATYSMIQLKLPLFILNDQNSKILTSTMKYFGFLREDGVSVGIVHTASRMPNMKHVIIGEFAKKMMYIPFVSSFIVLCESKNPNSRLKFIDRKLLKPLKHIEYNKTKLVDYIIGEDELPTAMSIWSIQRQDQKTSKKLVIAFSTDGNTKGLMKIIDISSNTNNEGLPTIIVTELNSFEWKEPITCVNQIEDSIIFASGSSINSTSYNIAERKLNNIVVLVKLSSKVISISTNKETSEVLVTTNSDSIYKFKYLSGLGIEKLQLTAKDPSPKSLVNEAELVGGEIVVADKLHSSVVVMDQKDEVLQKLFNIRMSCIPRVYFGTFKNIWESEKTNHYQSEVWNTEIDPRQEKIADDFHSNGGIISVGVNGEITTLRKLENQKNTSSAEELNLPFADKLNGKGLFSLYKPFFSYRENKGSVIDLDLDSISNASSINLSI